MKNAKKFTVTITSALLAVAALTSTAEATCGFSNPTESSSFAAGDTMSITWTDIDNEGPKCADLSLTIELRVGSRDVQTSVAVVGDGIDGSTGGTSYEIPTQLPKTDDTYFLEMHDSAKGFQNFSARFAISGVESGGDDPSDPGKNGTDPDPEAGKDGEGEDPDGKGKSGDDTPNGKDASDDASNTTETDNQTDETDNSPTKGQNGDSGTGNQPNGSSSAGGASTNSPDNNNTSPTDNTQPAAASSWFVSFASLAIVTVTVSLSNMF